MSSQQSMEEWTDHTIKGFFRVTLDPSRMQDANGHRLHFLEDMHSELEAAGRPISLSTDSLEDVILDAGSHQSKSGPLGYLLACWKRIVRTWRSLRASGAEGAKMNVIKEARRLCLSYCFIAVNMPEIFGRESEPSDSLTPHLLAEPESDRGIDHDFMSEAVSRFNEDESIKEALVRAMEGVSWKLSGMSMNDDYKPCVSVRSPASKISSRFAVTRGRLYKQPCNPQILSKL